MTLTRTEITKRYQERHPEIVAAYHASERYKKLAAEKTARYRARHPEKIAAYKAANSKKQGTEYRSKYSDRVRASWHKYRQGPKYRATYLNNHFKRNYGITLDEYNALLAAQGGVCKICLCPDDWKRKQHAPLCVDHEHKSGKVRGLLCHKCNLAISLVRENIDILANAIRYLSESMKEG